MPIMHVMTSETELMVQNLATGSMPMHFEWGEVEGVQFSHEQHNTMFHGVLMDEATIGILLKLVEHCLAKVELKTATKPLVLALQQQIIALLATIHGDDEKEQSA